MKKGILNVIDGTKIDILVANKDNGFSQLFFVLDIVEDIQSGILCQELIM